MFKLDEKFIEDLGLRELNAQETESFLKSFYEELEFRVGEELTKEMSDDLLSEFGYFVDESMLEVREWLINNQPGYENDELFLSMKQSLTQGDEAHLLSKKEEASLLSEYGAMQWLILNRPDYPLVVSNELEAMKSAARANRQNFLAEYIQGRSSQGLLPSIQHLIAKAD